MNAVHRWFCRSDGWRRTVRSELLPWVLDGVELGDLLGEVCRVEQGQMGYRGMAQDRLRREK